MNLNDLPGKFPAPARQQDSTRDSGSVSYPVRSLVAVELTHLGDLVAALPAMRILSSRLRPESLSVVVGIEYAALLSALEGDLMPLGFGGTRSVRGFVSAVAAVRALRPDMVLSLSPARRNVYLTRLSGAPVRGGFLTPGGSAAHYVTGSRVEIRGLDSAPVFYPPGGNIERRALSVCRALGLDASPVPGPWRLRKDILDVVGERLRKAGHLPGDGYIVVHPGARWERRRWPGTRFAGMLRVLLDATHHSVMLISPSVDAYLVEHIMADLPRTPRVRVVTPATLVEAAVIIAGADMFVGNDSGPLHLAAALGTPCVGLYGPAAPSLTAPLSAPVTALYHKVECSPCEQIRCPHASALCMEAIGVEPAARAVLAALRLPRTADFSAHA